MVTRLDLVAKGTFWDERTYTRRAPKGSFPLAIVFTLAEGRDAANKHPATGLPRMAAEVYQVTGQVD